MTAHRTLRRSNHVEPRGLTATARHYIRDLVYGASDGIITTLPWSAVSPAGRCRQPRFW